MWSGEARGRRRNDFEWIFTWFYGEFSAWPPFHSASLTQFSNLIHQRSWKFPKMCGNYISCLRLLLISHNFSQFHQYTEYLTQFYYRLLIKYIYLISKSDSELCKYVCVVFSGCVCVRALYITCTTKSENSWSTQRTLNVFYRIFIFIQCYDTLRLSTRHDRAPACTSKHQRTAAAAAKSVADPNTTKHDHIELSVWFQCWRRWITIKYARWKRFAIT